MMNESNLIALVGVESSKNVMVLDCSTSNEICSRTFENNVINLKLKEEK
jgi:hypothetical protein